MSQHTLAILLQDGPASVHRATSLLRRRSVEFASLTVARSETPGVSRMTLVLDAGDAPHVVRQLDGLVDVLSVRDVTAELAAPRTPRSPAGEPSYRAQADGATGDDPA